MGILLDRLKSSREIQSYSPKKLELLAQECRQRIIDVVSHTGGHLASSLGAVELTIALAKEFDFAHDKIIWDVGHQTYTYKILTGRNERFEKLGLKEGLAKFLSPNESKFDHFGAGHASTSVSAALGISVGRDLNQEDYKTIAVIGDGSMTGGLAFEALNHAGHLDKNLIVILNDNEMSIDPVVGALSKTILSISSSKTFNLLRAEFIKHQRDGIFPAAIKNTLKRVNESFMTFFTKGIWFEKLNFRYFGQVDGHSIKKLLSLLKVVKKVEGPVLLHVITQKGKGYPFAEENSGQFHGVGPFEPSTGTPSKSTSKGKSYTAVWGEAFSKVMAADEKTIAISAAMLGNTGLANLHRQYPDRVFDVGIAESHAVTFAGGLATQGLKPFVVIYSTFLQRGIDNIVHDIALQNLPVRFILDRAGFVGADGATHHGMLDLTYLRMIPGMAIMAPKDGKELQDMIQLAHNYQYGPVAIRFPRANTNEYRGFDHPTGKLPFGKGELVQSGSDILIIAVGSMVNQAIKTANKLKENDISIGIINARFVKPLDKDLILRETQKVKFVVTMEENTKVGGFGSGVLELFAEEHIFAPTSVFGIPDQFIKHATYEEQMAISGLDVPNMVTEIQNSWQKLNS